MRTLPLEHPGTADHRSPGRLLWWLVKGQWRTMLGGVLFGIAWMLSQALMPAVIGLAIDEGVTTKDNGELLKYSGLMFGIGVLGALAAIMRHRFAVTNWLTAAYRVVQLVTRQAVRLGATLPRRVATGEVVSIGNNDLSHVGNAMEITARAAGAVVSFFVVAALLLNTSVTLGLLVLIGVPVLMLGIAPMLKPLQRRSLRHREMMGELANLASDIVAGLRVLRGVGGERVFHDRYARESQRVREAGVQVGKLQSLLDAAQIALPGLFVVLVVWLGARFAVAGTITVGELVAFYGYAAFLMLPLRTATEAANKWIRGFVAAGRICRVLSLEPEVTDPTTPAAAPPVGSDLVDVDSGLRVVAGQLTALVADEPDETAAIADRLGRYSPGQVRWGDVPLEQLPRAVVRGRIVVSDTSSTLFSGDLQEQLDLLEQGPEAVAAALHAASGEDVLEALPGGLHAVVAERGRSFSGGQRQRLVLARALTANPEVLILVEPTSAVDAHTEARIAHRLPALRAGRTTVVTTTSPLMLEAADQVAFFKSGRVVAVGPHRDLLRDVPAYRQVVTREEEVPAS
jgi:ABC-type multidrug transport system fused ATPase/permease subunit